jgi:hypothetical protein
VRPSLPKRQPRLRLSRRQLLCRDCFVWLLLFRGLGFVFARRSGCFCQALAFGCAVGRSGGSNVKRVFLLARSQHASVIFAPNMDAGPIPGPENCRERAIHCVYQSAIE